MSFINIRKHFASAAASAHGECPYWVSGEPTPPFCNTGAKKDAPHLKEKNTTEKKGRAPLTQEERDARDDKHKSSSLAVDVTSMKAIADILAAFKFDWWQATLWSPDTLSGEYNPENCEEERAAAMTAVGVLIKNGLCPNFTGEGGQNGYRGSIPFFKNVGSREVLARVSHASRMSMPNVTFFGGHGECPGNVDAFKRASIPVLLSRADVRVDITRPGLFEAFIDRLIKQEEDKGGDDPDKGGTYRLIDGGRRGKTLYVGAPKSRFMLRVYQKDLQRAAAGEIPFSEADPDLFRIEGQFRPSSKAKFAYGLMSPQEMAQSNPRMRRAIKILGELLDIFGDVEIVKARHIETERTYRRSADHGFQQYGMTFARAALADIVDEEANWARCAIAAADFDADPITAANVMERMVADFEAYIADTDVAARAIEEAGLNIGGATPEETALRVIRKSEEAVGKAILNRLVGLHASLQILEEYKDARAIDRILEQVSDFEEDRKLIDEFVESTDCEMTSESALLFMQSLMEFVCGKYDLPEPAALLMPDGEPQTSDDEDEIHQIFAMSDDNAEGADVASCPF